MDKLDELLTDEERPLRPLLALHGYTLMFGMPDDSVNKDTDINLFATGRIGHTSVLAYRRTGSRPRGNWYMMYSGPSALADLMAEETAMRLTLAMITRALVSD